MIFNILKMLFYQSRMNLKQIKFKNEKLYGLILQKISKRLFICFEIDFFVIINVPIAFSSSDLSFFNFLINKLLKTTLRLCRYYNISKLEPIQKSSKMMDQQVKIPFLTNRERVNYKQGYFNMLKERFMPHIQTFSITTAILFVIMIAFILPRILYSAPHYQSFLVLPSPQMDKFVLDVQLIKSNKFYIYQTITAMFLHENYLHLIGNMIFAVFIMYELEYCWKPSVLIGICAGLTAHFMAIITGQGKYVGFSGALAGYYAVYFVALIINCPQLSRKYERTQLFFMFWLAIVMSFMIIGNGRGALMHLFGYLAGLLYGAGFYPSSPNSILSSFIQLVLKFVSVFVFIGLGLLALIA